MEQIKTKLKFVKSEKNDALIGFITKNEKGKVIGVRENDPRKKKICILSKELNGIVKENVLYSVEMFPMISKNGYIVSKAEPYLFDVTINTNIVKGAIYNVTVSFGNKTIVFDPMDGIKESVRNMDGVLKILEEQNCIANKDSVISDFIDAANALLKRFQADGYYVGHVCKKK